MRRLREPLTDLYGPFILPTDTSLETARLRLTTAMEQTRELRIAFTDRVYSKYRVCLHRPPPDKRSMLAPLQEDSANQHVLLLQQIHAIKHEKMLEKREAHKINAELAAATDSAIVAVENAEQLGFVSAGLNLVILPESQVDPLVHAEYEERGPIHLDTGNRVRGISQAAAVAGEVILDRTRKAAAMRVERQRRRQLQLLAGEVLSDDDVETTNSYSRLQVLSRTSTAAAPPAHPFVATVVRASTSTPLLPTTAASAPTRVAKKAPSAAAKAPPSSYAPTPKTGRSRSTIALSANTLLSLNPTADEINAADSNKLAAATAALVARGVGAAANKTTQQRLRHPHPESFGGRRRATSNPNAKRDTSQNRSEPFLQEFLAMTLPPVPGTKERLERKPLPVCSQEEASTPRARKAVQCVLDQFKKEDQSLCDLTKIRLLHGLKKLNSDLASEAKAETPATSEGASVGRPAQPSSVAEGPLDPILTFSVMHAVGLVARSTRKRSISSELLLPDIDLEQGASEKLLRLRKRLMAKSSTLSGRLLLSLEQSTEEEDSLPPPSKRARVEDSRADAEEASPMDVDTGAASGLSLAPRVESIRGGGGVLTADDANAPEERVVAENKDARASATGEPPSSDAEVPGSAGNNVNVHAQYQHASAQLQQSEANRLAYANAQMHASSAGARMQHDQTLSALHLAQQLRQIHHPSGELADYIGNLQHQRQAGYDLSSLMPGAAMSAQNSLAALGLTHSSGLVGYTMQDRAAAARAMYAREQQTAALMGGGYPQSNPAYSNVNVHAAAVSAMLGSSAQSAMLAHNQYPIPQAGSPIHTSLYQSLQSTTPDIPAREAESSQAHKETEAAPSVKRAQAEKPTKKAPSSPKVTSAVTPAISKTVAVEVKAPVRTAEQSLPDEPMQEQSLESSSQSEAESKEMDQDDAAPTTSVDEHGMKFFVPKVPSSLSPEEAALVRSGNFSKIVSEHAGTPKRAIALEYLVSVGTAVPIPKALVAGPLKERLNTPGFKNAGSNGAPTALRDMAASAILVWLWAQHESNFQQAFEKSGRIDVDPDCKWIIQAAVDTAVRGLALEIADAVARGKGPFADVSGRKGQPSTKSPVGSSESEKADVSKRVDIHTAVTVSKALMTELRVDGEMDNVLPKFQDLVEYLDESRMCALRAKAQERTLLAALIARKTTMADPFSHAYTSSMVRAGEALGHGKLFETVQDEDVMVATMIPYDIFTDESGSWEDPNRPDESFTPGLSGEELMRRAHARAMIQKSLRRLQDKHNVRGGTSMYGPYADPATAQSTGAGFSDSKSGAFGNPRTAGFKRRASSISEPPVPPGTGSAQAKTSTVYDPRHVSAPLEWDADDVENSTYGRHAKDARARSLSLSLASRSGDPRSNKKTKRSMSMSAQSVGSTGSATDGESSPLRSTREIEWADVAGIFQNVELPKKATPAKASAHDSKPVPKNIIAPFCREVALDELTAGEESDTEEDLSEEAVIANHQLVLDHMKAKLSIYLEERKKQQERRKSKSKA